MSCDKSLASSRFGIFAIQYEKIVFDTSDTWLPYKLIRANPKTRSYLNYTVMQK